MVTSRAKQVVRRMYSNARIEQVLYSAAPRRWYYEVRIDDGPDHRLLIGYDFTEGGAWRDAYAWHLRRMAGARS